MDSLYCSLTAISLTPNRRLAAYLQQQFADLQQQQGQTTWCTPTILPLASWLVNSWQQLTDPRIVLSTIQERVIWRELISSQLGNTQLALTELLMSAHQLMLDWQLPRTQLLDILATAHSSSDHEYTTDIFMNNDLYLFAKMQQEFSNYCHAKQFITRNQLPLLLAEQLANNHALLLTTNNAAAATSLNLFSFEEYIPTLRYLLSSITALPAGYQVKLLDSNNYQQSYCSRIGFMQLDEQLYTIANWAKQLRICQPTAKIGVVVPQLPLLQQQISQVFLEVFGDLTQVNLSIGQPFHNIPIIKTALTILRLQQPFSLALLTELLESPYIGHEDNSLLHRIELVRELRQLGQTNLNLNELSAITQGLGLAIPNFFTMLATYQNLLLYSRKQQAHYQIWLELIQQIFHIFQWPGHPPALGFSMIEYAALQRFYLLLQQELMSLQLLHTEVSYPVVVKQLMEIAGQLNFQPEIATELAVAAPINILGVLETAGLNFDYLWVMGFEHENWPTPAAPNPFLPLALQKKFQLPHATNDRELLFCKKLTLRLQRSAPIVIFSYLQQYNDRPSLPSRLIASLPTITPAALLPLMPSSLSQQIFRHRRLESRWEAQTLPLQLTETINFNSVLLTEQARCPFRAFAKFRLQLSDNETTHFTIQPLIINKQQRGKILHRVLEKFWGTVNTQSNLLKLTIDKQSQLVQQYLTELLEAQYLQHRYLTFHPLAIDLEQQYLQILLQEWLAFERQRAPFNVYATEWNLNLDLANQQLQLRIDRVDQLADGEFLIIDYKTGKQLPVNSSWLTTQPEDIQLPLYYLAIKGYLLKQLPVIAAPVIELAWAHLQAGIVQLKLATLKASKAPLPNNLMQACDDYWLQIFTQLIEQFQQGIYQPIPAKPTSCQGCVFIVLCRRVL